MTDIKNKIDELIKKKSDCMDKLETLQKSAMSLKVRLEIELEFFNKERKEREVFLKKLEEGIQKLEDRFVQQDSEIEKLRKQKSQINATKLIDEKRESYEKLYKKALAEARKEREREEEKKHKILTKDEIDDLLNAIAKPKKKK